MSSFEATYQNSTCPPDSEAAAETVDEVNTYYSKVLKKTDDLKTNACCTARAPPAFVQDALKNVHPTVLDKYYGCGLMLPEELHGRSILDLGSGSGRDCFLFSQWVGAEGKVVGLDMSADQLRVANEGKAHLESRVGYSNVTFIKGYIEELDSLLARGVLTEASFDVIISNCVINLSPDKRRVFAAVHRLLKTGGEMYFSDVYCNQRLSPALREDSVLWGECLSGALYRGDFHRLVRSVGFLDPRVVESKPISISNKNVEALIDRHNHGARFDSITYRLFKFEEGAVDDACEDYGQAVVYKGTVERQPAAFALDEGHVFITNKVHTVCGNTFRMLRDTRLGKHFTCIGDFSRHYGLFECGPSGGADAGGGRAACGPASSSGGAAGGCC